MEKEFVPYTHALTLKELGFDEPCLAFYQEEYTEIKPTMVDDDEEYRLTGYRTCKNSEIPEHYTTAPTYSAAFRWFREKHDLACYIYRTNFTSYEWVIDIDESYAQDSELDYTSYEKAELACLDKLLEIINIKSE